ncbi:hypothetical protein MAR_000856 [Mya arenaria]|uniref:Uncharacterized protein n=1 Tax=Mya arenaria TaxID=6604 RepID=A0ABY7FA17_MYAAR|nr:uncharacterized protein LOC128207208 [Mya arenaria]WAR19018.1 hypothetical protein MAR_000856 [Mya arenaria]
MTSVGKSGDVAERSPSVISANLKEGMLLRKKLIVLDRSERAIVHQIKVDQKVLYKRFQARLTRSRLAHARLLGQRDVQRELRSKNLGDLNTNIVAVSEEDYLFLEKLEQRPCTASSFSPCIEIPKTSPRRPKEVNELSQKASTKAANDNELLERPASACARISGTEVKDVNISRDDDEQLKVRPATTLGMRVDEEFLKRQLHLNTGRTATEDSKQSNTNRFSESTIEQNEDTNTIEHESESERNGNEGDDTSEERKPTVQFLENVATERPRPNTVAHMNGQVEVDDDTAPRSPSSPNSPQNAGKQRVDFFQEGKKLDMVSLRLKQARSVDFTDEVQKFCDGLEEVQVGGSGTSVDYYSVRLQMSLDQANSKSRIQVPGTPEDENKRSIGNIFVRSLTVPNINMDFNRPVK